MRYVIPLVFWFSACLALASDDSDRKNELNAIVKLAMYQDKSCSQPLVQDGKPFIVEMNTSQVCFSFSYTDPDGIEIPTSHKNFRCQKGKVIYDKYPLSPNCQEVKEVPPTIDYSVGSACQFADSHKGGVYEKLLEYTYPGHENCVASAHD